MLRNARIASGVEGFIRSPIEIPAGEFAADRHFDHAVARCPNHREPAFVLQSPDFNHQLSITYRDAPSICYTLHALANLVMEVLRFCKR